MGYHHSEVESRVEICHVMLCVAVTVRENDDFSACGEMLKIIKESNGLSRFLMKRR